MSRINLRHIDLATEEERTILLPHTLSQIVYPTANFSTDSIFGAAHSGELKGIKNPIMVKEFIRAPRKVKTVNDRLDLPDAEWRYNECWISENYYIMFYTWESEEDNTTYFCCVAGFKVTGIIETK